MLLIPHRPAIQFRMEQQGLVRKESRKPLIGGRARVSEVLTGRRSLTLDMVRRVKAGLGISADLLIGATPNVARGLPSVRAVRNARSKRTVGVKAAKRAGRRNA